MKEIPLYNRAGDVVGAALVDDEDYEFLMQWTWGRQKGRVAYARRSVETDGHKKMIFMHRVILNAPAHAEVDHVNRNGLDNTRNNLRLANQQEQAQNKDAQRNRKNKTGQYKGISQDRGKWTARIKLNGKSKYLGHFSTQIAAARAYDQAARILFGEFAFLNFPQEEQS